ncbi:MAG: hypothetical protein BWK78_01300 [Thiotrichaceae bacterium IS1]|nr:MAG: hypothetical protein BWK78_01300 [Thiotrichaceae bacterium IS1]
MNASSTITSLLDQHVEEAAFLWLLRDKAVHAPHYSLADLAELDERIEAHLDGLRIAGEAGWEIAKVALRWEQPGEVFTAAVLAFESGQPEWIDTLLAVVTSQPELSRVLVSALGWLPFKPIANQIDQYLNISSPQSRYLGLAASAVHRINPGTPLDTAINDPDPILNTRALRAVGELGRKDRLSQLRSQYLSPDATTRFWAAWSATLLGEKRENLELLQTYALLPTSPYQNRALSLLLRSLDLTTATRWLNTFAQRHPEAPRILTSGLGIVGDPVHLPWLIQQMEIPELARIAGESFTLITGMTLNDNEENLADEKPANFTAGPTDNPAEDDVALDPDEDLLWPNPTLIKAWWEKHQKQYQPHTRYLLGQPITPTHCQQVLRNGLQRQRIAAALELTLRQPGTPLFETRAPGVWQQQWLKVR